MKKLIPIVSILISTICFSQVVEHDDVLVGKDSPAYGVKIKVDYTNTGGWARGYHIANNNNTENFISFAAVGAISGGTSSFSRGYIGRAYNDTFMSFLPNGNVGIGTNAPSAGLSVMNDDGINVRSKTNASGVGTIKMVDGFVNSTSRDDMYFGALGGFLFKMDEGGNGISDNQGFTVYNKDNVSVFRIVGHHGNSNYGNVGIGTTNPTELLTVNGKILCEEVEVIQDVAPDYVFQKYYTGSSVLKEDYTMPTLEEVEAFTKANHHLPEVPSAAAQKVDGMQLKEMTNLLLQKVEELTLYTIEQEKRINTLEAKLAEKE
ncbi:hypothetical protein [Patiriisocius marinus]|uniref:Uncharacterized protein n=1 Tax=Patiriisocius marinus TaxID=1397112 RepID=A0A5J4IVX9_9FLAO|nr:hypothetical protein [Patiriisocius marinus]GER58462.1 hypothetical protein ULMA_05700 [Patiriisocius marinus]